MRKIIVWIAMAMAIPATVASCQRSEEIKQEGTGQPEYPPHTVGDWEDGDTIRGEWDEGRPATHEDSIRFGLI